MMTFKILCVCLGVLTLIMVALLIRELVLSIRKMREKVEKARIQKRGD